MKSDNNKLGGLPLVAFGRSVLLLFFLVCDRWFDLWGVCCLCRLSRFYFRFSASIFLQFLNHLFQRLFIVMRYGQAWREITTRRMTSTVGLPSPAHIAFHQEKNKSI